MDTGLLSLLTMAGLHGIAADEARLRHEFGDASFSAETLLLAAKSLGMSARLARQPVERLDRAPLPAIALGKDGGFFILARYGQTSKANTAAPTDPPAGPADSAIKVLVQQPGEPPTVLALADFLERWAGQLIFLTSKASYAGEMAKFDFTWFIPAIVKYRKLLAEILLISLVLQLIGLVTPMFFQVVMDKVLVNHAMQTLNVIAMIYLIAAPIPAFLQKL